MNQIIKFFPGNMYGDGLRHVQLLRDSSLDWTVIRAPRLTLGASAGRFELGYFQLTASDTVSRAAVATAMVDCLTSGPWSRQAPMIRSLRP